MGVRGLITSPTSPSASYEGSRLDEEWEAPKEKDARLEYKSVLGLRDGLLVASTSCILNVGARPGRFDGTGGGGRCDLLCDEGLSLTGGLMISDPKISNDGAFGANAVVTHPLAPDTG